MTEVYFGGGKKKYSRSQIKRMIKNMVKAYKRAPYYKKKAKEEQAQQALDADKLLEEKRDDAI